MGMMVVIVLSGWSCHDLWHMIVRDVLPCIILKQHRRQYNAIAFGRTLASPLYATPTLLLQYQQTHDSRIPSSITNHKQRQPLPKPCPTHTAQHLDTVEV